MCLGPLAARRAEATLCPTRGRNRHVTRACTPCLRAGPGAHLLSQGRPRAGAGGRAACGQAPSLPTTGCSTWRDTANRSAGAPPPHPASPARSGGRPAVPTPRATPPRTLGRQPRPLPLSGGGGGTHSPLGVETKTKPRTRCAHTCAHTRRVLNQAAAGLTGQQRRRRQKERASEPEAPGRVGGGGGERRRGVWTRRGPQDVSRSAASTWHQPVGNWRRALF